MIGRKADEVAGDLLGQIVEGSLPVGSLLPRESDLAERYGVGRSVVREANKLLEVHQLVRPIKRRGTEVLDPLRSTTPAVIRAMLVDRDGRVDPAMLAEFLELRATLDIQMSALAAERRTDEDLSAMDACLARLDGSMGSPEDYYEAVDEMGLAIARAAGNRILVMLVHWHRQITGDLGTLLREIRSPTEPHRQGMYILVDAIRQRDSEAAATLVAGFHDWANERLLEAVQDAQEDKR